MPNDEFRFRAHELLVELDASIAKMMMMVAAKEIEGAFWAEATNRHYQAFLAWHDFIAASDDAAESIPAIH
ncbi:hypothetical protein [Pseudomonas syringae]|uniref:Uncharacterized protein n=2 Tax=Pseudomonas syringae TaxID=317 RepID=A0AB35JNE8_PSESY|nr:hypothetical protein [Pseudomonas syringae]AVX22790.1 hypothetical protein DA456_04975 [Pseudomonas syringae pv. atrofaciens]MBI6740390.1 hypothetical protein [Pseudomonas syringae]MBI6745955.1 hypothetical protein [Pseudomonas syringae]MBI6760370.1 hypothetical protein [Pseudomonas syringae]MBI6780561.1 hypothetical protein [Pseudomonas syringae]